MKQLLTAAAALTILAGSATFAIAETTIRWGTEAGYKPFMFKTSDGELTGFDYEIGNAICAQLKATCSWVEQDWDGIIPALNAGKYDAILASMSITAERQKVVDFTGKYYHVPYTFVGATAAGLMDDATLDGKTVGVQRGTVTQVYLEAERPNIYIKTYPTQDEVWLDLTAGRIDAGMANKIVINDGFLSEEKGVDFSLFGQEYADPKYFGDGTGIAVRKSDDMLKKMISDAIIQLRENGTYQAINTKYFPLISMETNRTDVQLIRSNTRCCGIACSHYCKQN